MERPFDAFSPHCPSREVVDDVIGRWPALVLVALLDNPRRFADTARAVGGISDRMLSRTLTSLTNDGLISRAEQHGQHVTYQLTDAGRQLATALKGVVAAVYEVMPQVLAARQAPTP
ncbi:helix-turn-helix domain-containing protein [Propionicimonas sp.]|uniref:winged helix-turn-helix transcriptional regulator n=1 Tax=Propionicimonas sp. TaxID=1955623 RepID=UPI0017D4A04F|nr:helix-turn-helix domain-containing protein [Propionicimonas sp.]MBU3975388.1 helix-turn-helix transcriptional regulator [Actinomycetota bacterium]MBA3020206.1 helix-turn-helix transcriptional regulator [Propionicimonas sp.]MBU3986463.1 helix-turn-helix transcriptional regulator [Actinomycetota bacterium]MBU4008032.1 helix-turn-helix transcriptional regulator [Actinomycetota bacterium]MBU4064290.1 helix-turn-helix transcriptional regulator [Actinomycetota bacterium]